MNLLKRSLCLILIVVLLFPTMAGCRAATPKSQVTTYKIGFMAAITGGASFLGVPERDAAVMIQEQLKANGSVVVGPDGVEHPVEILIMDTESNPDVTISVAKKLINDDKVVAIVGTTASGTSMALVPVMQEAQIPMVSMASSSAIVEPVSDRKWIFKTAQNNDHTAPWQVRYAKAKGFTRVANFHVNDAYGEDGAKAIRKAAAEQGVQIVLEETFGAADKDMTAQLTKLNASDAQALLVTAIPPAAAILTKQFREMNIDMPIIHNHGIGMRPFIDVAGIEAAEGVLFPMGKLVAIDALAEGDPQRAVIEQFIKDYQASSGNAPSTFAGHAWDGLMLTLEALARIPSDVSANQVPALLRDELEKTQGFVGISGIFNIAVDDHVGMSADDVVLCRIVNGEWEYFPPEKW
jgi:branched-chain amino acid transport system substrate-binding protein